MATRRQISNGCLVPLGRIETLNWPKGGVPLASSKTNGWYSPPLLVKHDHLLLHQLVQLIRHANHGQDLCRIAAGR
jgi:hypothetical protein